MAVIFENELKRGLQNGKIMPTYILFGDDSYLITHYENLIISKTCGKDNDFDLQKFERNVDLQAIYDALNQFSMLGGRKCVILTDYDFESAQTEDFDRLVSLLSDNYEFSTFVLKFDGIEFDSKRSARAKKLISAAEKGLGCAVSLNHRENGDLIKMLVNGAKKRGTALDTNTARYMLEICGADINTLTRELEKLCFFVSGGEITKKTVDDVCVKSVEASVYEYVKKIISCDYYSAVKILNDLLYMRFEPMIILYTAASAFVDMARVNAGKKVKRPINEIAVDFSYKGKEFVLERAANNLRKFNDKKLILCMDEILRADSRLKSFSADEKFVLEEMTIRLIYIITNGDILDKA